MDLLKTILIYMSMVFVSSVQNAPEATITPTVIASSTPPAIVDSVTPTPTATAKPTVVPTPNITPNNAYKTIKSGDSGEAVTELQTRLAELGYYEGDIDGRFGNQTRRAVERFQYANGLSSDGIAGMRTLTVLYESKDVVSVATDTEATPEPSANPMTDQPTSAQTVNPDATTPLPTYFAPTKAPVAETAPSQSTAAPSSKSESDATQEPISAQNPESQPEETSEPATAPSLEPEAEKTEEPSPSVVVMDEIGFVLAENGDLLMSKAKEGVEPRTLTPLQVDEKTIFVPLLDLLESADILVLPSVTERHMEVAFALSNDLYLLAYDLDAEGIPQELVIAKNGEPQVMEERTVLIEDGMLYLPLEEVEKWTGLTFALDEENKTYAVTFPEVNG